jgi:hydroxyacylglutathione hydrolase
MTFYGGDDRIGALNQKVVHKDTFEIGSMKVTCFETPCHTTGHICYLVEGEGADPAVFTGWIIVANCSSFFDFDFTADHVIITG